MSFMYCLSPLQFFVLITPQVGSIQISIVYDKYESYIVSCFQWIHITGAYYTSGGWTVVRWEHFYASRPMTCHLQSAKESFSTLTVSIIIFYLFINHKKHFFLSLLFTLLQCRNIPPETYNQISVGQMPVRGTEGGPEHQTDNISAGLPECVQYNARATARDNTKDTHPVPRKRLKTLTAPGMQPVNATQ